MSAPAPGPHYLVRSVRSGCYLGVDCDGDAYWFEQWHRAKRFTSEERARRWADDNVHSSAELEVVPFSVH